MAGQFSLELMNGTEFNIKLDKLREAGGKKTKITSIMRESSRPLVSTMKQHISKRPKSYVLKSRYASRVHPPGTLRRSIKFKNSKKHAIAYYIGPDSTKAADTYYAHMYSGGTSDRVLKRGAAFIGGKWVAKGTKIRGYKGKAFAEIASRQVGTSVLNTANNKLGTYLQQVWNG